MPKPNPNDISIGEDRWITFIDVAGRQDNAVSIDDMLAPLDSFWSALETECVAACCGIDAFALWPEDIRRVSALTDHKLLAESFASLRRFVEGSVSDVFVSQKLNNYLTGKSCCGLSTTFKGMHIRLLRPNMLDRTASPVAIDVSRGHYRGVEKPLAFLSCLTSPGQWLLCR